MEAARGWFAGRGPHVRRYVRYTAGGGALATLVYLPILWGFALDPLRTAYGRTDFANFFDLQARALLDGRLSVPRGSLQIEGFIIDGQEYAYFAPGPALARMPLALVTSAYDGRLTAPSMLIAWLVTVVVAAALLWRVRCVLRGKAPLGRSEALACAALVVAATAGSSLLYLGSMPMVYHESGAWSVAMALLALFCILGVVERPTTWRVVACGVAVFGAVLSRAPTGWGAITGAGIVAIGLLSRARTRPIGRWMLLAALLPALFSVGFNWAKFSHPYLFPLEKQVWTEVNAHRRAALEANGGDLVNPNLIPSTLNGYFRPDGIRFIGVPPFITFPSEPPKNAAGGFLDQTYRTGSIFPFMPALAGLALWGAVTVFRPRGPSHARHLRVPIVAASLVAGPILVFGYISYRYTADVLPLLVLGATVGLVDLVHLVSLRPRRQQRIALGALVGLVAFAVAANAAVSITAQTLANPGRLAGFVGLQQSFSEALPWHPLDGITTQSDDLPERAPGEHLHIVGDCEALFQSQAETYWPWQPVEVRGLHLSIDTPEGDDVDALQIELARTPDGEGVLTYEEDPDRDRYRFAYRSRHSNVLGDWAERPDTIDVVIRADIANDSTLVIGNGGNLLPVPLSEHDASWFRRQNLLRPSTERWAEAARDGVEITELPRARPPLCERLAQDSS